MARILDLAPRVRDRISAEQRADLEAEAVRLGAKTVSAVFGYRSGRWVANATSAVARGRGEDVRDPAEAIRKALAEFRHEARKHAIAADDANNPFIVR